MPWFVVVFFVLFFFFFPRPSSVIGWKSFQVAGESGCLCGRLPRGLYTGFINRVKLLQHFRVLNMGVGYQARDPQAKIPNPQP